jgi:F-type H+-transporting ATPase subunit b
MTSHLISTYSLAETTASLFAGSSAGGGVTLDFDLTFLAHLVAFAVLVMILKPLLFDPLMKLFEERERRTEGAKLLARRMDEKAGELLLRYEAELEAQILAEGRAEVARLVEQGRAKLEADRRVLRAELSTRAADIARDIASRVLGREVA